VFFISVGLILRFSCESMRMRIVEHAQKASVGGGDRIFLADEHDCQSAVKNANYNID